MKFTIILFNLLFVIATLLFTTNYAIAGKHREYKRYKTFKKSRILKKRVKYRPYKRSRNIIRITPFHSRVYRHAPRVQRKVIHLSSTPSYYRITKSSICDSLGWSFKRRKCRRVISDKYYTQSELQRCFHKYDDHSKLRCLRRNGFYDN